MNDKREERLSHGAKLRRHKRKEVPVGERQSLLRPTAANQTWSMDLVLDRTAGGRAIKCPTVMDDATHEAGAIKLGHAISGHRLTRILDHLTMSRGLPKLIRTDNGEDLCGTAMVRPHQRGVVLRLMEPRKSNQNAYVESVNGRLRDGRLNKHGLIRLLRARARRQPTHLSIYAT